MRKILSAAMAASLIVPAVAQKAPSETEQREACIGDALRLCTAYIPDRGQIRSCMTRRHDELSQACRAVFDASVKAAQARSGRHGG